jgi:membrane dipeptidase
MGDAIADIPEVSARARQVHERALVWDAHMDSLQRAVIDGIDLGQKGDAQADLVRWKEGGVDVQVFAVWVDTVYGKYHAARRSLQQIDAFHRLLETYPDRIELARTGDDIRRIVGRGKLAALLAIEGGLSIQNDLALLRTYHRLGATSMTLTHSATIDWADSSTDGARWNGLNDLGRDVIREMNRLRMVVDVSHVSDDAVRDVLEVSTDPIIASHSSVRALCNHPRNLSDALIRAIADAGGVIGINFYAGFLCQEYADRFNAAHRDLLAELNEPHDLAPDELDAFAADRLRGFWGASLPRPAFSRIAEHIDYIVQLVGPDHVGIGSDLDSGPIPVPEGLDTVSDYPRITEALLHRGYEVSDIEKILGGNFLRVFEAVTGRSSH